MYIFTSSVVETIKLFCISVLCSVVFSMMIYRDTVIFNQLTCFILNMTSLILFLFIYQKNCLRLYMNALTRAEYMVPALSSYFVYLAVSTLLYVIRAGNVYKLLFQHTRFLEPIINAKYAFVSFVVAQVLTLLIALLVPRLSRNKI